MGERIADDRISVGGRCVHTVLAMIASELNGAEGLAPGVAAKTLLRMLVTLFQIGVLASALHMTTAALDSRGCCNVRRLEMRMPPNQDCFWFSLRNNMLNTQRMG